MPDLLYVSPHNNVMNWSVGFSVGFRELLQAQMVMPAMVAEETALFQHLDLRAISVAREAFIELQDRPETSVFFADVQSMPIDLFANGRRKLYGFLHGGPYEPFDPYAAKPAVYHRAFRAKVDCLDEIWVATHYHKMLVRTYLERDLDSKVKVVGFPCIAAGLGWEIPFEKKEGVIYVSRQSKDKGVDIARALDIPTVRFDDRWAYFKALAKAKYVLVPSRKDTFGLVASEAFQVGTIPLVPRGLCYPELYTFDYPFYLDLLKADRIAEQLDELDNVDEKTYKDSVELGRQVAMAVHQEFKHHLLELRGALDA